MINGIPINDMENAWVYWSNWDGLGDVTSSIQIQRGLSATTLATPSIGGIINVITDPTKQKAGVMYQSEIGTGSFSKQTLYAHTGVIDNKFALSVGGVRKVGNGVVDKTYTDAWAYYLGTSYQVNDKNRLELYALGAPQQHGQNLYKLNAATYSHELAMDLGFPTAALNDKKFREQYEKIGNIAPLENSGNKEDYIIQTGILLVHRTRDYNGRDHTGIMMLTSAIILPLFMREKTIIINQLST